jgi:RNA polymerase sigma-70 factor (ECF subfamily)
VVADYRKTQRRRPATPTEPASLDSVSGDARAIDRLEASDLVSRLLDTLDDTKREVFVLAELEGMTMAEIAEATSTNPNTVSARLRAARAAFECALVEHESEAER